MVYPRSVSGSCEQADNQCRTESCWLEWEAGEEAFAGAREEVAGYIQGSSNRP